MWTEKLTLFDKRQSDIFGSTFVFLPAHKAKLKMQKSYQANAPQQPDTTDKTMTEKRLVLIRYWQPNRMTPINEILA